MAASSGDNPGIMEILQKMLYLLLSELREGKIDLKKLTFDLIQNFI